MRSANASTSVLSRPYCSYVLSEKSAPKTSADLDDEVGVLDEVGLLHVDVLRPRHLRLHFHHLLSVQQKNFLISNF